VAEEKEIVLVNKARGRFTINFQGAFQNKSAVHNGKFYLSQKEFDFVKSTYPHILEGDTQRLFPEGEEPKNFNGLEMSNEEFFAQNTNKIKAAIKEMDESELDERYNYAQLNDASDAVIKALENRILESSKDGE